jgi:predicted permease
VGGRFVRDVRLALRGLRRAPAFTVSAVVVLALGIGMAAAMTSVYDAVLRRPLPVRDPDRVAVLWTYQQPDVELAPSLSATREWARASRLVRGVAGVSHWGAADGPVLDGDRPVVLKRALASGNFFDVLGARPAVGRLLRPEDDAKGAPAVMVLSYSAWRTQFGGDPSVVGRRLLEPYTRRELTVVGVAPAGLDYPSGAGYWVPAEALWRADQLQVIAVARLAPGASADAARAEYFAVAKRLLSQFKLRGATASTFTAAVLGDVRPFLVVLTSAVGLLLLIACVNVGGLLLVRAAARARELAVRRALGARYADVVRQLLAESGVLAALGGAAGLACAVVMRRLLVAAAPAGVPRLDVVALEGVPLGTALAVTLLALLVAGVAPALGAARVDLASPIRQDARAGRSRRAAAVRGWLVASQVALAVVMLAAAGLLSRSLARLETLPLGYRAERLAILSVSWNGARDSTREQIFAWGERAVARLGAIPGVSAVSPILIPPFMGPNVFRSRFLPAGAAAASGDTASYFPLEIGNHELFRALGLPVLRGRGFLPSDREGAPQVAVLSESAARRLWPGEDALGKRMRLPQDTSGEWVTVVGIVPDTRYRALREATPTVYSPWRQSFWQGTFAVRSSRDLASLVPAMRRALRDVDPQLALWDARTMDEMLDAPLAQPRLGAWLVSAFSATALLLAAVGLYGVVAGVVRERTREIGVRLTLGATPARVWRDVVRGALAIVGVGAAVGLAGALAGSRLVAALLFEVSPTDPLTLAAVCLLLLGVALVAAYLPARRASRVDPARALRAD